jgi:hypothetical protein
MIADAPFHMPNVIILRDFPTPTVKEEIRHYSSQYSAGLSVHPNDLVVNLMVKQAIVKIRTKGSAYQILSAFVLFVV